MLSRRYQGRHQWCWLCPVWDPVCSPPSSAVGAWTFEYSRSLRAVSAVPTWDLRTLPQTRPASLWCVHFVPTLSLERAGGELRSLVPAAAALPISDSGARGFLSSSLSAPCSASDLLAESPEDRTASPLGCGPLQVAGLSAVAVRSPRTGRACCSSDRSHPGGPARGPLLAPPRPSQTRTRELISCLGATFTGLFQRKWGCFACPGFPRVGSRVSGGCLSLKHCQA